MSFWDNMKKFAQPYADDDYDDYDEDEYLDDYDEPEERPARRAAAPRRAPAPEPAPMSAAEPDLDEESEEDNFSFSAAGVSAPAPSRPAATGGFTGQVLNMKGTSKQDVVLFRPTYFNDSSKAADDLRNNKAVIVNMENVDKALARRVIDFLSGSVYALDGDVKKIAQSAYLFCPPNMNIVGDLETLQAEVESYI